MATAVSVSAAPRSNIAPLGIIGLLFFVFGFVTWLNGSLIPFLKIICHLTYFEALFVTFAFYIAYTVFALPMSAILLRTGYRNGMALGLGIMAVGALVHIPAAYSASFPVFLLGLFVLGTGLTILQTASNPYIVLLGPIESAATRICIMGIVNKMAGVIVPLVFTALILSDVGDPAALATSAISATGLAALAARMVIPYLSMALVLLALAALVWFAPLPPIEPDEGGGGSDGYGSILHFPNVVLGALTLFAYMGLEVLAGDTIGLFGSSLGVAAFATLTSYTMAFMVLGYLIGVFFIPRYLSQRAALIASGIAGLLAVIGTLVSSPQSSAIARMLWGYSGIPTVPDPVFFVAFMGMAHALVWPTVWPLALQGLGRFTAKGSALLVMSISGGALIPLLFGRLAGSTGNVQLSYWLAAPCYLVILFYAVKGHKIRRWR